MRVSRGTHSRSSGYSFGRGACEASQTANGFLPEGFTLEQWEDEMIREALQRSHGNKSQAARLLGLSRNALPIGSPKSVLRTKPKRKASPSVAGLAAVVEIHHRW